MSKNITIKQSEYDSLKQIYNIAKKISFGGIKTSDPDLFKEMKKRQDVFQELKLALENVKEILK